jgi:exodeoxyribonuclease VII large subunit
VSAGNAGPGGRVPSRGGAPARPDGIPGSPLSGPFPVGHYAARLRERLRDFSRVQVFGEVFGFKAGRARVWFELRDGAGALPCSMWRGDWDALGIPALADGAQIVAAGGCDYYPGSRTSSPQFSFAVTGLRLAGEGDLLAQVERLRRTLLAECLHEPQ